MRTAYSWRMVSRANYSAFRKAHPEINISFNDWKEIIYTFNRSFRDYILETGDNARLICGFGVFTVKKKKRKPFKILPNGEEKINLAVDWKATKEAGKYVYHKNDHTNGFTYSWIWAPHLARFKFSALWNFKPSRETSRKIKEFIRKPDGNYKYIYQEKRL